jgi:hypothetical protein
MAVMDLHKARVAGHVGAAIARGAKNAHGAWRARIAKGERIVLGLREADASSCEKASAPGGNGGDRDREVNTRREFSL